MNQIPNNIEDDEVSVEEWLAIRKGAGIAIDKVLLLGAFRMVLL